jgi:hypothetical protein
MVYDDNNSIYYFKNQAKTLHLTIKSNSTRKHKYYTNQKEIYSQNVSYFQPLFKFKLLQKKLYLQKYIY